MEPPPDVSFTEHDIGDEQPASSSPPSAALPASSAAPWQQDRPLRDAQQGAAEYGRPGPAPAPPMGPPGHPPYSGPPQQGMHPQQAAHFGWNRGPPPQPGPMYPPAGECAAAAASAALCELCFGTGNSLWPSLEVPITFISMDARAGADVHAFMDLLSPEACLLFPKCMTRPEVSTSWE